MGEEKLHSFGRQTSQLPTVSGFAFLPRLVKPRVHTFPLFPGGEIRAWLGSYSTHRHGAGFGSAIDSLTFASQH